MSNKLRNTATPPEYGQFIATWVYRDLPWSETLFIDPVTGETLTYNPVTDGFEDYDGAYLQDFKENPEGIKDLTFWVVED